MKRKRTPAGSSAGSLPGEPDGPVPETVVPEAILEQARRAIESDRLKPPAKCTVCGEDCAPNSAEGLCWVCRRLKLSAWRDSDSQMPVQE